MALNVNVKLVKKEKLKEDIYSFTCESKELVKEAKPGQFLEIKCGDTLDPILRRPISIADINKEEGINKMAY